MCALLLAGCAATAGPARKEPVPFAEARNSAPAPSPHLHPISVSSADAELVVARAIAEHEMRRP